MIFQTYLIQATAIRLTKANKVYRVTVLKKNILFTFTVQKMLNQKPLNCTAKGATFLFAEN